VVALSTEMILTEPRYGRAIDLCVALLTGSRISRLDF
jgi:hypothetical protein